MTDKAGSYTTPDSVADIGWAAFSGCASLTSVTIPDGVITIEWAAFGGCTGLRGVYFEGSAPALQDSFFMGRRMPVLPDSVSAVVYHRAGTTGFGLTFADRPTALWPFLERVPCPEDLTEEDRTELGESQHAVFIRTAPARSYEVQSASFITGPWRTDGLVTATSTQKRLVFDQPEVQAIYRVTLAE